MNNWKIVGNIASGFGVIFVVFGIFSAILTYNAYNVSGAPAGYYSTAQIMQGILSAMLNYMLFAALSFLVAWFCAHAEEQNAASVKEEEMPVETEPKTEEPKP